MIDGLISQEHFSHLTNIVIGCVAGAGYGLIGYYNALKKNKKMKFDIKKIGIIIVPSAIIGLMFSLSGEGNPLAIFSGSGFAAILINEVVIKNL